ncbi:MAG: CBS domain-containing protein, partial [Actinobacteria bacterium]|nr:CBS domain-containing protein [Actinomycetota bacterium]
TKVRRVPVLEDGQLVGIISQADVAATGDDDVTGDLVEIISTAS